MSMMGISIKILYEFFYEIDSGNITYAILASSFPLERHPFQLSGKVYLILLK